MDLISHLNKLTGDKQPILTWPKLIRHERRDLVFPPCKGIPIPESGKVLPVESGILGFGNRNASSTDKEFGIQHLESEIQGIESRIQDCLGFPYMGRLAQT